MVIKEMVNMEKNKVGRMESVIVGVLSKLRAQGMPH